MKLSVYTDLSAIKANLLQLGIVVTLKARRKTHIEFTVPRYMLYRVYDNRIVLQDMGFHFIWYGTCGPDGEISDPTSVRMTL